MESAIDVRFVEQKYSVRRPEREVRSVAKKRWKCKSQSLSLRPTSRKVQSSKCERLLSLYEARPVFELVSLMSVLTALVIATMTIGIETKKRTLEQTSFVAAAR